MSPELNERLLPLSRLRGDKLKTAVEQQVRAPLHSSHPSLLTYTALGHNFEKLPIDWQQPRTHGEIRASAESFFTAIRYAYIKTGRKDDIITAREKPTIKNWSRIIQRVVLDNDMKKIFQENLWRPITTVTPSRGIPLQYLLPFHFPDSEITGIDLGTGTNAAFYYLNSPRYINLNFPGKEHLSKYAKPVNLIRGIGVDKQDPADKEWIKAGSFLQGEDTLTDEEYEALFKDLSDEKTKLPFILADVLDIDSCTERIQTELKKYGHPAQPDFVFSSFLRHQLGEGQPQRHLQRLITRVLPKGGIWIDLGGELVDTPVVDNPSVTVYEKKNGELEFRGRPFILNRFGRGIKEVNLAYFGIA